jgi:sulfonate transport system permease protein
MTGLIGRIAIELCPMSSVGMSVEAKSEAAPSRPARRRAIGASAGVQRFLAGLAIPLALAAAWEIAVLAGLSDGRLVPPPSRIFAEYVELWGTGDLIRHVVVTLVRVAVGFGLGAAAATVLGALAGYSSLTRRLIDPTLQGLRAVRRWREFRCSSCGSAFSRRRNTR